MMEFARKRKRGQNKKVQKMWLSKEGYRIIWRKEIHGVRVPARFQATVRTVVPNYGGVEDTSLQMWDFTDFAHRLFKTRKAAEESCEQHFRLWTKASEVTGIRGLVNIFGKVPAGHPVWVRKRLKRNLYEILSRPQRGKYREEVEEPCTDPSAQPKTSVTSPTETTGSDGQRDGPASPVTAEDLLPTPSTKTTKSPAPSAEAPVKGRKRTAAKRTKRQSASSTSKRKHTTGSSKSVGKHSRASRKSKSMPSES